MIHLNLPVTTLEQPRPLFSFHRRQKTSSWIVQTHTLAAPSLCFPSLPTLLSNQAEKPLKAGFWKLMSSFHFPHMAEQIRATELPPSTVLESTTRLPKSTELTPINWSACNGIPVIYASGRR